MLNDWIRWLSSLTTSELVWVLAPMLMLDCLRYTLGSVSLWITDWFQEFRDSFRRKPVAERFSYQPRCCAVVAGLNEADSIGLSLQSLAGSYPDLQIVVVDDGSVDGMADIATEFAKTHPECTVVRKQQRGGKSSALNAALPFTDAEVIVCVDSDSSLGPSAIWEIVQPLADPKVGAVSGTVLIRNPFKTILTWIQALEYYRCIFLGRMFTSRLGILGIISGAFGAYRREAVVQVGAWDVGPGEDGDLTLRLRRAGYEIVFAPYAQCYTNPLTCPIRLTKQRRRWEWAVVTLECRKHLEMANPFDASFRWSNLWMLIDRWIYGIVLHYAFLVYLVWQVFHLNEHSVSQYLTLYFAYLVMEILQLGMLLYYSLNRREVLSVGLIIPLMPAYYIWMRCVSLWAVTEELLTRRSYRDQFVPERVRRVTWHW